TLAENTDGRPQSRSPATAQREARRHSALLSPASYTISWGTIRATAKIPAAYLGWILLTRIRRHCSIPDQPSSPRVR
ncbi:hypothetical protein DTW90_23775, partial [Neorhizobium sp. P12A]